MTSLELLICLGLILFAAFTSAAEIALFSLSRFQLRSMKERFRSSHRKIKRLLSDPGGLLVTILVLNEVINISLSAVMAEVISRNRVATLGSFKSIPDWAVDTVLGILLTTPLILLFCEITPKVIAARANQLIATLTAGPVGVLYGLFKPVRYVLNRVVSWIAGRLGSQASAHHTDPHDSVLKEADFLLMVEEGHKEGAIHQSELDLIKNVFELDDATVADVYTPLSQVRTLGAHTTLKAALLATRGQHFTRIPILSEDRKKVLGILHSKDLLRAKLEPELLPLAVETIMRKPVYVTPGMRLNVLFRKLKQEKTHLAVVQESTERALGIITMHDIFESLFEDLFPESEIDEELAEAYPAVRGTT